ncbi:hypothetical protein MASR1M12_42920 [Erysipelotrichia bacterium]
MITAAISQPGTIREQNQDYLLIDARLRLAIIADGSGPRGLQAAEIAARSIWNRINDIAPVTGSNEVEYRLQEAVEQANTASDNDLGFGTVSIAAVWVNRGVLAAFTNGHCAVACSINQWQLQRDTTLAIPVQPGQAFLLCSEGFSAPMAARLMHQASPALPEGQISAENLQTALEAFAGEIARAYDGDDRSAILISLEKSDLTAGEPHELELFEHFNKEYRFPLWAPLLAAAGSALSGLLALFRMCRHLPKLLAILGKKD